MLASMPIFPVLTSVTADTFADGKVEVRADTEGRRGANDEGEDGRGDAWEAEIDGGRKDGEEESGCSGLMGFYREGLCRRVWSGVHSCSWSQRGRGREGRRERMKGTWMGRWIEVKMRSGGVKTSEEKFECCSRNVGIVEMEVDLSAIGWGGRRAGEDGSWRTGGRRSRSLVSVLGKATEEEGVEEGLQVEHHQG
jgi:hypothetical protein